MGAHYTRKPLSMYPDIDISCLWLTGKLCSGVWNFGTFNFHRKLFRTLFEKKLSTHAHTTYTRVFVVVIALVAADDDDDVEETTN